MLQLINVADWKRKSKEASFRGYNQITLISMVEYWKETIYLLSKLDFRKEM